MTRAQALAESARQRGATRAEIRDKHTEGAAMARKALRSAMPARYPCVIQRTSRRPYRPIGPRDSSAGPLPSVRDSSPSARQATPSSSARAPSSTGSAERRERKGKAAKQPTPPPRPARRPPPTTRGRAVGPLVFRDHGGPSRVLEPVEASELCGGKDIVCTCIPQFQVNNSNKDRWTNRQMFSVEVAKCF